MGTSDIIRFRWDDDDEVPYVLDQHALIVELL